MAGHVSRAPPLWHCQVGSVLSARHAAMTPASAIPLLLVNSRRTTQAPPQELRGVGVNSSLCADEVAFSIHKKGADENAGRAAADTKCKAPKLVQKKKCSIRNPMCFGVPRLDKFGFQFIFRREGLECRNRAFWILYKPRTSPPLTSTQNNPVS